MLPGIGVFVGEAVTPGSQTFSTAGTFSFTVPNYNTMTIEIWGGGGSGGNAYNGGASSQGGFGGNYVRYSVSPSGLSVTETVVVGAGGAARSGNVPGLGGGFSQFGNSITANGGNGGNSQFSAGGAGGVYTPSNPRPSVFTLVISESGGAGGVGNGGVGGSVTYAGGGGGGMTNDYGGASGGSSTYGGAGGTGGDGGGPQRNGASPAGGGGASDWDGGPSGYGGTGRIVITWA